MTDPLATPASWRGKSELVCAGCGALQPEATRGAYPFRCRRADERPDVDHLITRRLDPARFDLAPSAEHNPFLRYRRFLHAYHLARDAGWPDTRFVDLVTSLDSAVASVDGHGFVVTPLRRSAELEARLGMDASGAVWIKDETRNVSGSHKARHLMGVMLYLRVVEALGLDEPRRRGLAIACCGNAALAAAVVARAAGFPLRVFVPDSANPDVVARIGELGAEVEVCRRAPDAPGDPTYLRFRRAVAGGALPFCCQGNENGLTIEGGATLGLELAEAFAGIPAERLFVQVGGGALASACLQAFTDASAAGAGVKLPRIFTVQTRGAFPLRRAYDLVRERMRSHGESIDAAMRHARTHRSAFMWPWETAPHSVAHGILDDETYDWAALVEGMLHSDGSAMVVDEEELARANDVARETSGIDVDHTGSAGLAGLIQALRDDPAARHEQLALIFSGARRGFS